MEIKHLIIVSLLLAVLTLGAVSASEDIASNDTLTVDNEGADIEEAPVDDVIGDYDESDIEINFYNTTYGSTWDSVVDVYNDNDEDVTGSIAVSSGQNTLYYNNNVVVPCWESFTLSASDLPDLPVGDNILLNVKFTPQGHDPIIENGTINVDWDFQLFEKEEYNDDWWWNKMYDFDDIDVDASEDVQIKVKVPKSITQAVTYTLDGTTNTIAMNNSEGYFTISANNMEIKNHPLAIRCGDKSRTLDVCVEPRISIINEVAVNQDFYVYVILPQIYSGTVYVYNYNNGAIGTLVAQGTVSGKGSVLMPRLTAKGEYEYFIKFESSNYSCNKTRYVIAIENSPDVAVTVTPSQVAVGNPVTVNGSGPKGTFDLYVDGIYKKGWDEKTSFSEVISGLTAGQHRINVVHYGQSWPADYSGLFYVTIGDDATISEPDNGTFTALQKKINGADAGSTITLENDYNYDEGFDSDGIKISKSLTIDGKGHTVDANGKSRIFNCTAPNIILKNIIFINGFNVEGGAIYCNADNGFVSDCSFINCSCYKNSGGAIYNKGINTIITGCGFINCSAADDGGAVCLNNAEITYCNFKNCNASSCGGALDLWGSNVKISHCIMDNCSILKGGLSYGGAIHLDAHNATILNCTFINCLADEKTGGAIFLSGNDCTIINCSFTNCNASVGGAGAIYSGFSNNLKVINCIFDNCSPYSNSVSLWGENCTVFNCNFMNSGYLMCYSDSVISNSNFTNCSCGAIYTWSSSVINCLFRECISNDRGAIYYMDKGFISNCSFENCHATRGGAISFMQESNDSTVNNSCFKNCSADEGGAIYWNTPGGRIYNSNFSQSHAQNGGAIYVGKDIILTISNSKFEYNTAENLGGAIYFNTIGNVINCTLNGNSDPEIYPDDEEPVANATTFKDLKTLIDNANSGDIIVLNSDYFNDGSISEEGIKISKSLTIDGNNHIIDAKSKARIFYLASDNIVLKNIMFVGGSASSGGAVYNGGENCSVSSCEFINCYAREDGGAISIIWGENCSISSCNFTNCSADGFETSGGAIYNWAANCDIISCLFKNCHANNGGAILVGDENCSISSCEFIDCSGNGFETSGGAILVRGENCSITLCDFTNCHGHEVEGDGGAISIRSGNCNIGSCNFINCFAGTGGAISIRSEDCIIISCDFTNCHGHDVEGDGGAISIRSGNCNIGSCNFINCFACDGGAISIWSEDCSIISCDFTNCHGHEIDNEEGYGQAIYNWASNCKVKSCNFIDCNAYDMTTKEAAIYDGAGDLIITDCTFKDTNAPDVNPSIPDTNPSQNTNTNTQTTTVPTNTNTQTTTTNNANTIKLTLKTVKIKKSAKKLVLQATLKQGNKALSGKKITFKFNGKKYTAKTNKNGIAKVTIKKSVLKKLKVGKKVTYQASYGKTTVKKTTKIKK